MHPNVFLKTFWRMEVKPQVFVAMSFHKSYDPRFSEVIKPAIESIEIDGVPLTALRVDNSKTGDSILTDIMDGIAHSQLILADVSTMRTDPSTGYAYRNGNVMYEVGLALACRQPSEVLLVRDDYESFLFDVSTIPHLTLDFDDTISARSVLHQRSMERLHERTFVQDTRVQVAIAGLSSEELKALQQAADYPIGTVWGRAESGSVDFFGIASIPRLLDKELIQLVGTFEEGHAAYHPTPLGRVVAELAKSGLRKFKSDKQKEAKPQDVDSTPTENLPSNSSDKPDQ